MTSIHPIRPVRQNTNVPSEPSNKKIVLQSIHDFDLTTEKGRKMYDKHVERITKMRRQM